MKRATSPEQLHQLFADALNATDVTALTALYDPEACLIPRDGPPARGLNAIRELLTRYCALNASMQIKTRQSVVNNDTALLMSDWTMTGTKPDGSPVEASGTSVEIARKTADGSWLYVIDLPHGILTHQ
jgi:uncharacterized protein (TIGR02246 family)